MLVAFPARIGTLIPSVALFFYPCNPRNPCQLLFVVSACLAFPREIATPDGAGLAMTEKGSGRAQDGIGEILVIMPVLS